MGKMIMKFFLVASLASLVTGYKYVYEITVKPSGCVAKKTFTLTKLQHDLYIYDNAASFPSISPRLEMLSQIRMEKEKSGWVVRIVLDKPNAKYPHTDHIFANFKKIPKGSKTRVKYSRESYRSFVNEYRYRNDPTIF